MGRKVGARNEIEKLLNRGITDENVIREHVIKKFPDVKPASVKKYINDWNNHYRPKKDDQVSGSVNPDIDGNTDGNTVIDPADPDSGDLEHDKTGSIPANTDSDQTYEVKDFKYEVKDTPTPKEADAMAKRYKDGLVDPEPVHLELVPQIIGDVFKSALHWDKLSTKLKGWNDPEKIKLLSDSLENLIKKRIHISMRNADIANVGLAGGYVFTSIISHVIFGKAPDPDHSKTADKIIAGNTKNGKETIKKIEQLRSMAKEVAEQKAQRNELEPQKLDTDSIKAENIDHLTADPETTQEATE